MQCDIVMCGGWRGAVGSEVKVQREVNMGVDLVTDPTRPPEV